MATRRSPRSSGSDRRSYCSIFSFRSGRLRRSRVVAGASDPPMVVLISAARRRLRPRPGGGGGLGIHPGRELSRARRSPPSSAEPVHAPVPATPLAGGRRSRHCRRMDLLWLGRPAALGCRTRSPLDPDRMRAPSRGHGGPRAVAALSWRRPASAGSWELRLRRRPHGRLGRRTRPLRLPWPPIHLLVEDPSGRLSSRLDRAAVALGYAAAVVTPVWRSEIATIVLAVLVVAVCALSYRRAVGPARRGALSALRAAAAVGLVLVGGAAVASPCRSETRASRPLLALEVTPRGRRWAPRRAALTFVGAGGCHRPVVELGESRSGTTPGRARAGAGRPESRSRLLASERRVFVDSEGRRLALPDPGLRALGDDDRGRKGADRCACPRRGCTRRSGPPGRQFQRRPGSRPRMRPAPRPRYVASSPSSERLDGGSSTWATTSGDASSGGHRGRRVAPERLASSFAEPASPLPQSWRGHRPDPGPARSGARGAAPACARAPSPCSRRSGARGRARVACRAAPVRVEVGPGREPTGRRRGGRLLPLLGGARERRGRLASGVTISVTTGGGRVRVEVEDDGLGGADPAGGTGPAGSRRPGRGARRGSPRREPGRGERASPPRSCWAARRAATVRVSRSSSTGCVAQTNWSPAFIGSTGCSWRSPSSSTEKVKTRICPTLRQLKLMRSPCTE